MTSKLTDKAAQLIERVTELMRERLPEPSVDMAQSFVRHYYAWVATEDLLERDPEDLYGAALSHWNLSRQRRPGIPIIRVYNPSFEEHGWQCTHTVVEIVTDDMPFLVDSMTMELNRHGLTVHQVIHPVLRVTRDADGHLQRILPGGTDEGISEATMHFEVDRITDPKLMADLRAGLLRALGDVRAAVEDWPVMRERLTGIAAGLETAKLPLHASEVGDMQEFLRWVANEHFTFLGYRDYELLEKDGQLSLCAVPRSGLGLLRSDDSDISRDLAMLPLELGRSSQFAKPLIIAKAGARSTVHRPVPLDYLGIKRFNADGQIVGEQLVLGLFTAQVYNTNPRRIPLLRGKIERVLARSGISPKGHAGKALQNILETFPRDDLFQATDDELLDIATGILHLKERQRLRLFARKDPFDRFVSCLVYVHREKYNTEVRLRIQNILMQAFNGESSTFTTQFNESVMAQLWSSILAKPGQIPEYSISEL